MRCPVPCCNSGFKLVLSVCGYAASSRVPQCVPDAATFALWLFKCVMLLGIIWHPPPQATRDTAFPVKRSVGAPNECFTCMLFRFVSM